MNNQKLLLKNDQSPGDIVTLTATVRDLHLTYPGRFLTDVRTPCPQIWENNPYITPLRDDDPELRQLKCEYPLIHSSNARPVHFLGGFTDYLNRALSLNIEQHHYRGDIHLSEVETSWMSQIEEITKRPTRFWIVVGGGKYDFTTKWWNPKSYQTVVNAFQGRILFVQCGEEHHWHPRLHGVIDLVGKTDLRQFIRLMYHADGVLCPITFSMHLAAAVKTKPGMPANRPCVVVAGGREPPHWEAYPNHQFMHTVGALTCCEGGGCWKSRCQLMGDGDSKDKDDLCLEPVQLEPDLRIARCMDLIRPEDVIRRIELYYEGGILQYDYESAQLAEVYGENCQVMCRT